MGHLAMSAETICQSKIMHSKAHTNTRWWLASAFVLLVIVALDHFISKYLIENVTDIAPAEQMSSHTPRQKDINTGVTKVDLVSIRLPPLPNTSDQTVAEIVEEVTAANAKIGSLASVKSLTVKAQKAKTSMHANMANANDRYMSEMASLKGVSFQIDMPPSKKHRTRIGKFLYQCVGIQLGIIETRNEQKGLIYLSKEVKNPSAILRQVNGEAFTNERGLISLYGSGEQVVRVYPNWIDQRLSNNIGLNLNGKALTQFSAQYMLQNNLLQLINIKVNNTALQQVWTLASGFDTGCQ